MNAFVHQRRRRLAPREIAQVFIAHGGRCYKCTRKLGPGDRYDIDHIVALENGGTNDHENLAPICAWCHGRKTAADHGIAAKAKRVSVKHHVPAEQRRSARGFRRPDGVRFDWSAGRYRPRE